MRWTRTAHLALALAALLAGFPAASHARPEFLPIRRTEPGKPAPVRPELEQLARRWAEVGKVNFMRGVRPGSSRLRAGKRATGPFTTDHPETLRIAALRADFWRDSLGTKTSGDGHFDLVPDTSLVVDPPPHNRAYFSSHMAALARYYKAQSYGAMVLEYDVYPKNDTSAFHLRDMSDYGPWNLNQTVLNQATRLVRDTFKKADQGVDTIPWSKYDRVMIFHAGADFQTDVRQDSPFDIPTFTLGLADTNEAVTHDRTNGQTVNWDAASMIPEVASQDGLLGAVNGALAHEFGLLLGSRGRVGVPDLYNIASGLPVIGTWSIMDSGNLLGTQLQQGADEIFAIGLVPGPHDIWSKLQLFPDVMQGGFVFSPDTTLTLPAIEKKPEYGYIPLTQDEYLLLENRETDPDAALGELRLQTDPKTGVVLGTARIKITGTDTTVTQTDEYDVLQPGSGVLCFHVDNSVLDFYGLNADTVYGGTNTLIHRHGLGLIQSDGSGSLGDGGSQYYQGGPYDPFYKGNFGDSLLVDGRPSSRGNSGGLTGVSFKVPDRPSNEMHVRVHRRGPIYGWPSFAFDAFRGGAAAAADLDGDGRSEYYAAALGGFLYGYDREGNPIRGPGDTLTFHPFYNLRRNIKPELMTMPEWVGGNRDALLLEWDDSTRAEGARVKLMALGAGSSILPGFPPRAASLTTPLVRYSTEDQNFVVAGGADGRVWVFDSQANAMPLGDSLGVPIVGRLAVAPFTYPATAIQGDSYVAGAYADGTIRFFALSALSAPGRHDSAPSAVHVAATRSLALSPPGGRLSSPTLLAAVARDYGDIVVPGPTLFVVDSSGWMDAIGPRGVSRAGFPFKLPAAVAGIPTLGSLRDDGQPAILVATSDDKFTAVGMDGRPLLGFPASLPSGHGRTPGSAPLEYRDRAGHPVILAPTTSGDLFAMDSVGKPIDSGLRSVAQSWGTGAFFVNGSSPASPWILQIGDLGGFIMDSIPDLLRTDLVSFGPGVDEGRTGYLSSGRITPARAPALYTDLGGLRVYPNPARIAQIQEFRISFDLARSQTVRVRLYDLTGRIIAETRWAGHPAANVVALPLTNAGSGIYQCEVIAQGSSTRKVTPVAVVR